MAFSATRGVSVTYPPAHLGRAIPNEAQTELKPVRDDNAEDIERELARDECAARRVRRDLGAPHGHDRVEMSSPNPVDDARATHPVGGGGVSTSHEEPK